MKTYLECWIGAAKSLLSQALAGVEITLDARLAPSELKKIA